MTPTAAGRAGPNRADAPAAFDFGDLPGLIGYNLRRAQAASFRGLDPAATGIDLSPGQFSLLSFLDANPGLAQSAIARGLGVDKSTLSPALDALAGRGLIERRRSETDRRANSVRLTRDGAALLQRMRAEVAAQEAVMAGALRPGERDRLLDMLRRIAAALDTSAREDG